MNYFRVAVPACILLASTISTSASYGQINGLAPWTLHKDQSGCMIHTAYRRGTVLSIWAVKDQKELGFLLQNPSWKSIREDNSYTIDVRFDEASPWQIQANGLRNFDQDGPGIAFQVLPGKNDAGENLVAEFAFARSMHVTRAGQKVDSMSLKGSHKAIVALARCIGRLRSLHRDPFADPDQSDPVPVVRSI